MLKKSWNIWLNSATFAYNTSVHEGTRLTPYEYVFGNTARTPIDTPLPPESNESYFEYLLELKQRIVRIQTLAHDNLNKANIKSKEYYDRQNNSCKFEIGDKVLLLKEPKKDHSNPNIPGPTKLSNSPTITVMQR